MKNLFILSLMIIYKVNSVMAICPDTQMKESVEDCPWAELTREFKSQIEVQKDFKSIFKTKASKLYADLKNDSAQSLLKSLWGKSINFDEGVKATIVEPEILDFIFETVGVNARNDRIVHAGTEHSYGYLFSNLNTPYGYKRARWVKSDLKDGFGFKTNPLSPLTTEGTLFSNLSYFAAKIAFRDQIDLVRKLNSISGVSSELKKLNFSKFKIKRIKETIHLSSTHEISIYTDFVAFTHLHGSNDAALVYSYKDSNEELPKLITLFPVNQGFVTKALDPKTMGTDLNISSRYNAHIPGLTDQGNSAKGTREIK
jgi:hypothetical protein